MKGLLAGFAIASFFWCSVSAAETNVLAFKASVSNDFTFDTGVLRGVLRAGGVSKGLGSVLHIPTGTRLDSSMGLFSHYRLLGTNKRYGTTGWDWPSKATLQPDGAVEVVWAPTQVFPFEMRAVYRWTQPEALDLETSVTARTNLSKFECFLAAYFSSDFTNSSVLVANGQFLPARREAGIFQAFPRERETLAMLKDGRWRYEPYPVDWAVMPRLGRPIGVRSAPAKGITAVVMAWPEECFAVYTPYETDPHYSMYLSFFGKDLKSGESAKAQSRLLISANLSSEAVLRAYSEFLEHP